MTELLENPRSARVRTVAHLARKEVRAETRRFLLEGPQAVAEALQYRPELLHELFATPTALERHPELGRAAEAAQLPVVFVTEQVLAVMADTVTPQGVVAVCEQFPTSVKNVFLPREGEDAELPGLVAILEQVRDPGNAGTIIRAADAAGAQAVVMTGRSVDPYNPKVVRSTTGSLFHLPVAVGVDLAAAVSRARAAGYTVLAADVSGEDLPTVRAEGVLDGPTAWVFGNEARGLTDEDLALVDRSVRVPIYGRAESMNLATAASVCLYESAFAHRR